MIQYISETLHLNSTLTHHLIYSLFWILFLYLVRMILIKSVSQKTDDVYLLYNWRKGITYAVWISGILILSKVWITGFKSFATFWGLLSAGVAISLRDFFSSIAGWVFIMVRRPFYVGDRIEVGNYKGDVIDIRLFQFTIVEIGNWVSADQSTGRIVHIPNNMVFSTSIANYTMGFKYIWNEISVLITFESNWKKGKDIFLEIGNKHAEQPTDEVLKSLKEAAKKYMIYYKVLTPAVYVSVKDSGVQLTLRYLCDPKKRRQTEHLIWSDLLDAFNKEKDIDFAYTTYTIYTPKQTPNLPNE